MQEEMRVTPSSSMAQQQAAGSWESCVCYTPHCQQRVVYVQRCAQSHDLWKVALTPEEEGWTVAATGPLCPLCGNTLLMPAPIEAEEIARNRWS